MRVSCVWHARWRLRTCIGEDQRISRALRLQTPSRSLLRTLSLDLAMFRILSPPGLFLQTYVCAKFQASSFTSLHPSFHPPSTPLTNNHQICVRLSPLAFLSHSRPSVIPVPQAILHQTPIQFHCPPSTHKSALLSITLSLHVSPTCHRWLYRRRQRNLPDLHCLVLHHSQQRSPQHLQPSSGQSPAQATPIG